MTSCPPLTAMIFAAGRGERMRPLTDTCPKPLLKVAGQPLLVWQIKRLERAGFKRIVINHAWLGEQIEAALGDGSRFGVELFYSAEPHALETAGGIAYALPLLERASTHPIFLAVSGDIFTDYDYAQLIPRVHQMAHADTPKMHLVMVPNPEYHSSGDFYLEGKRLHVEAPTKNITAHTFGNIGLYDRRLFENLRTRSTKEPAICSLKRYYHRAMAQGEASGELYTGYWENIGTPEQLHALDTKVAAGMWTDLI